MLIWLFDWLTPHYSVFNAFGYLTTRGVFAVMTAILLSVSGGPWLMRRLVALKVGESVRDYVPDGHKDKHGTPTMGGVLVLASIAISVLLWGDLESRFTWLLLATLTGFGLIGAADDYRKLRQQEGLSVRAKFLLQSVLATAVIFGLYLGAAGPHEVALYVPLFKEVALPLGLWFIVFGWFVVVGSSNAVNLTDGLDGLAVMPIVLVAGGLGVFAYASGHAIFSDYLGLPYIVGVGEVLVFCAALCGAGLGFLWYNAYPAQMFMGDVGSLSLGAVIGLIAVMVRQEIVLAVMGGVFVAETLSVIVQVASFKLRGRRIFRMAPLHHHFELLGWPESRIIVRFWIITLILVLVGLATLKLR